MNENLLLRLRLQSGMTQEELSERSGISVRTIRNFERGLIQRPRRSSVDMLLDVLDPGLKEKLRSAPMDDLGMPVGMAAEWLKLVGPEPGAWRGSRPPRSSLVGRDHDVELLGRLVLEQQLVVITGPGGVGKSRIALAVAEAVATQLPDGVAVVELGTVPGERDLDQDAVLELAEQAVADRLGEETAAGGRHRMLMVLDNAEHLPQAGARLVDRLLGRFPGMHVLMTARRAPELAGAVLCELAPLAPPVAVELLLDRLRSCCPDLDLSAEGERLTTLVGLLDGLPRLIEFAAHRLRMVPLESLLTDGQAVRLLGSGDVRTLPHQRTPEASLRWSLALLGPRHERLLTRLARDGGEAGFRVGELEVDPDEFSELEAVGLLADLAETSLLQVDRGGRYRYRMLRHVRAFLDDPATLATA
ncbi:ATPase [Streptacidiphilus pinicola]|uniref:ATPase n=1 Tax=Streptacidiphilus pinicola TaxID=2219663 RepID=A0A2X0IPJ3_9ACTN|nr:helix-turn-helix domain-containing protein [Streptacidiphilus pinicola]RAG87114.1 ATPase [Streptacidiphilus pinicola]